MTIDVTFDTGYDDTAETKTDIVQISDRFRFCGRKVQESTVLNSTDEKTGCVSKTVMQRGGGSIEAGVHITTGPGKGISVTGYAQGDYTDNNGSFVKINADVDKKGNTDINITSGAKFGKNRGK